MIEVAELVETTSGAQPGASTDAPFSLNDFLRVIESSVATIATAWVAAEVVGVSRKGSVTYFELAESDARGARVAKVAAKLWRNAERILAAFREATGDIPKPGMRLLARVKPAFHPNYGLSLDIEAIDPSYTLGEIEAARRERRRKLQEAGLYDRNREFACPDDFRRVAVVSPNEAAALGDFREVADRLERAGVCRFFYHTASFQGKNAADTLCEAFKQIVRAHRAEPFCAVCIVRGGGSVADLAELDHYKIVWTACQIPFTVLTGIGHERDTVLLDEIASRRFDTPSKVALHIEKSIVEAAKTASADWQTIRSEYHRAVSNARRDIESLRESIVTRSIARNTEARRIVDAEYQSIVASAAAVVPRARREHESGWQAIAENSRRLIRDERRGVSADMEQIVGLGPRHTLARGFAIVRDADDRVVTSSANARKTNELMIEFKDGTIPARRVTDGS